MRADVWRVVCNAFGTILITILTYFLYQSNPRKAFFKGFFVDFKRPAIKLCAIVTALTAPIWALGFTLNRLFAQALFHFFELSVSSPIPQGQSTTVLVAGFVAAILIAPLFEEILFRGILMRQFSKKHSACAAIVGSALIFALVHPWQSMLYPLVFGLFTAVVVYKTDNLAYGVLLHVLCNAISLGFEYYERFSAPLPLLETVAAVIAALFVLICGIYAALRPKLLAPLKEAFGAIFISVPFLFLLLFFAA